MSVAIYKQCLDRVHDRIVGLNLPYAGGGGGKIKTRFLPWERAFFDVPITIHPSEENLQWLAGTCGKDDIGYGCQVTMVLSKEMDDETRLELFTQWREQIRGEFHHKRLTPVDNIYQCVVQMDGSIPKTFDHDAYEPSALVVWCWSRELRPA